MSVNVAVAPKSLRAILRGGAERRQRAEIDEAPAVDELQREPQVRVAPAAQP